MSNTVGRAQLRLAVTARRLLTVATIVTPLALVSCGPIAFGIFMTTDASDSELGSGQIPLLVVIGAVAATLISTLVLGWVFALRRRWQAQACWSLASISVSPLVLGTLAYEVTTTH